MTAENCWRWKKCPIRRQRGDDDDEEYDKLAIAQYYHHGIGRTTRSASLLSLGAALGTSSAATTIVSEGGRLRRKRTNGHEYRPKNKQSQQLLPRTDRHLEDEYEAFPAIMDSTNRTQRLFVPPVRRRCWLEEESWWRQRRICSGGKKRKILPREDVANHPDLVIEVKQQQVALPILEGTMTTTHAKPPPWWNSGSAISADVSQWRLHWVDEICKI